MNAIGSSEPCTVMVRLRGAREDLDRWLEHAPESSRQISKLPGFQSLDIHKASDGSEVVSYLRWRSMADHEACMKHPVWGETPLGKRSRELMAPLAVEVKTYGGTFQRRATDIVHQVGVNAPASAVYEALTRRSGLAGWWTREIEGESNVGGTLQFRFGGVGPDMLVVEMRPGARVEWECVSGPPGWAGTHVIFALREEDGRTILLFAHRGWGEETFQAHCSMKWATYLLSLKSLLEAGRGAPYPEDIVIDRR